MPDLKTQSGEQGALNILQRMVSKRPAINTIFTSHVRSNIFVGVVVALAVYVLTNAKGWTTEAILRSRDSQEAVKTLKTFTPKIQKIEEQTAALESSCAEFIGKIDEHDKFIAATDKRLERMETNIEWMKSYLLTQKNK